MANKVGVDAFDKFLAHYLAKYKGTLVTSEVCKVPTFSYKLTWTIRRTDLYNGQVSSQIFAEKPLNPIIPILLRFFVTLENYCG